MFDFYQRRKFKSILIMPVTRLVLLVVAVLMVWGAVTRYQKSSLVAVHRKGVESEVERLKVQKQTLEKDVNYLSDERGMEAEMRRQFDVSLPGEQVVVIVDPEQPATTTPLTKVIDEPAWYEFWQ